MFIKIIKISNFRNIKNAVMKPSPGINFIIGNNAQGKTSIAEAIYTTALLKSFRTNNIEETIKENSKNTEIEILVDNEKVENTIKFKYNRNEKFYVINGKKPDKNNFYSNLNTIIFYPEEVNYIGNYPQYRRNLLDRSIFYTNYNYIEIYKNYNKCLKQRNIFLKNKKKDFDCWKDQLIKFGAEIIRYRINFLEKINTFFNSEIFNELSEEKYRLDYTKNFTDINNIENELSNEFIIKKEREIFLGYTVVGPHRDDIKFSINNKSADKYSSQGQKRSLIISYKTAQIHIYKKTHGFFPILILDDMNSELDIERKNLLLQNILKNSGQVFITTTDIKNLDFIEGNKIFKIANGVVSSVE